MMLTKTVNELEAHTTAHAISDVQQVFTSLPSDYFGVFVENQKDLRELLWLVNTIGEDQLRFTAT
jgi:hypothetical protein